MTTLLRIDASARLHGSHTRQLADHFQSRWQRLHPDGLVVRRDLAAEPVPHLTDATIQAFHTTIETRGSETPELALSGALIRELASADHLLIASPLYNLTLPSTLKAFFDHVVRAGMTFEVGEDGYRGLLEETRATLITARGGTGNVGDAGDFQTGYLRAILAFIGVESVDVIAVSGTALDEVTREENLARAHRQLDRYFEEMDTPVWRGPLDEDDQRQITDLRQAQAMAIVEGDAEAYAELCTDDIQLLIPGQDVISGRNAFLQAERALFAKASFSSFQKHPLRIEGAGELAVEIGRQNVVADRSQGQDGVYSARQKYTHTLRRTPSGWRFAVLMSNPCE